MGEAVKGRRYESPLRERRARQTRQAILDAAQLLFLDRGYAMTPLSDVASEAGVSLATVKLVFGTKAELLMALWHRTMADGVDDPPPVADRPWFQEILETPDPARKMRLLAHSSAEVKQRLAPLLHVIETAAPTDAAIAELWSRIETEFHAHQRMVIATLARRRQLRRGLTIDTATDILWMLNHPRTYLLLVRQRGWSVGRYQKWLASALQRELVKDAG